MRALIAVGILVAASSLAAAPRADAATYCYDGEQGVTCGFVSLQQCLDANWGVNTGTCSSDPLLPARETIRSQPRKRTAN